MSQSTSNRKIKKIPRKDYAAFVDIGCNAYPGMGVVSKADKDRMARRMAKANTDPLVEMYGLYEKSKLIAGLRLFDFTQNVFSTWVPTGGGGFLAVDLIRKKEKAARDLMTFFIRHYLDRGYPMATLYPFRPDFYRKMGFGYGTKVSRYSIGPADLPDFGSKQHVRHLTPKDYSGLTACYDRYAAKTHGMFKRCKYETMRLGMQNNQMVGYVNRNRIEGYIVFSFKPVGKDNFILNDLHISEFVYENRQAFAELTTFLHTQADQINRIIYSTSDEHFHNLPFDPRDGSNELAGPVAHTTNAQGIGLMYRVLDTPALFRALSKHSFGGQDLKLKLSIRDTFLPENEGDYVVHFVDGYPRVKPRGKHEVTLTLDVADFSSLVLGAVNLRSLYNYGLAELSDEEYLPVVNRLFLTEEEPECTTQF